VSAGDVLRLQFGGRDLEVRVLELPHGNVAKRDTGRYFEVLRDQRLDPISRTFDRPDPD
jgi:hypothetical protein